MDLYNILSKIAVPRPNYSDTVDQVGAYLQNLLTSWGVPFTVQEFTLRPYMQLSMGAACLLLAIVFFILVVRKKPLWAFLAALAIPAVLILEAELFVPVVSSLVTKTGKNIIIDFPAAGAVRELVFAAHYDSKTDFFDHIQRAKIYMWIPLAGVLMLILPLIMLLGRRVKALASQAFATGFSALAGVLVVFWALVALGFGGYVFLSTQSPGAVDNAGSVTALLALARDIKEGKVATGKSSVTILLTQGEEVTLQGAHAYVKTYLSPKKRKGLPPVSLVNLELTGQKGNLFYWAKEGVFLKYRPADPALIERVGRVWKRISGKSMGAVDKATTDADRFLSAGIPAVTIGHSGEPGLGMGGFHCELDNLERTDMANLKLMVTVLREYIESYN